MATRSGRCSSRSDVYATPGLVPSDFPVPFETKSTTVSILTQETACPSDDFDDCGLYSEPEDRDSGIFDGWGAWLEGD